MPKKHPTIVTLWCTFSSDEFIWQDNVGRYSGPEEIDWYSEVTAHFCVVSTRTGVMKEFHINSDTKRAVTDGGSVIINLSSMRVT